jgi:hypothetical protein
MSTEISQFVLSSSRSDFDFPLLGCEWLVSGPDSPMSSKKVVINNLLVSITSSCYRAFPQHARMTMGSSSSYLTIGQSYVVPCLVHRRISAEEEKASRSTTPDNRMRSANASQRHEMEPNVMVLQQRCYLRFSRPAGVRGVQ